MAPSVQKMHTTPVATVLAIISICSELKTDQLFLGSGYVYFVPIIFQMLVNLAVMYKFLFGNLPQMQEKAKKVTLT